MTRTFVVGEAPEELVEYHRLVKEALDRSLAATKAGVPGREVYTLVCDLFEENGQRTTLSRRRRGRSSRRASSTASGTGSGSRCTRRLLGRGGTSRARSGDVVTLEPGLYRHGFGGCRLEDLVLVTEDGAENLTNFPYDLTP